jgi:hypothetical protein
MSDSAPVGPASDVWDIAAPTVPNSARLYDYYLGGKDNFPVDREAAEKAVAAMPVIPVLARANRAFLALSHVVTDGADESGITGVQEVYQASPTDPAVRSTAAIRALFEGFEMLPPGLTDVRTLTDPTFAYSPEAAAPGIWMLCGAGRKL